MSLLVGYSHPYSRLTDTRLHYGRIAANLDQGHFYPAQTLHMLDEERAYSSFSKEIDEYIKKNLFISISNRDFDLLIETLIGACRLCMEQKVMSTVAKTLLLQTLVRFAQETDFYLLVNHDFIERELYPIMLRIISFPTLQELFKLLGDIYARACKCCSGDDSNRLVLAMQYIQKNYYRKISLESHRLLSGAHPQLFLRLVQESHRRKFRRCGDPLPDGRRENHAASFPKENLRHCRGGGVFRNRQL